MMADRTQPAALSWQSLAESGRLARALDRESAAAPHLRKLRLTLEPKAEPHTLRLQMPCDCGSCIVKAQMKAGASCLVLVWNEEKQKCSLRLKELADAAPSEGPPVPAAGVAAAEAGTQAVASTATAEALDSDDEPEPAAATPVITAPPAFVTTPAAQARAPTPPAAGRSAAHVLSALAPADVGGGISSADSADDAALPLLDPDSRAVSNLRAMMSNPEKYAAPPVTLTVADAAQIYWLFTHKYRGIGQPVCSELAKHGKLGFYTALASLSAGKFVHVDARKCRSLLAMLKAGSPRSATSLLALDMARRRAALLSAEYTAPLRYDFDNGRFIAKAASTATEAGGSNVFKNQSGRYQARHRVHNRQVAIGHFDTAVEAAVAYARAVGEYQPPAPPTVATEAEGLRLHLSSSNATGYKGLTRHNSGRFQAQHRVDGGLAFLGLFDTAVEAAVAYARAGLRLHLSSSNSTGYMGVTKSTAQAGRFQARHRVDGRKVRLGDFDTAVEAAVAYARAVGEYQPPAPPTVATEAEGLRLHLSSSNATGYKGVVKQIKGRFEAAHYVGGRRVHVGIFDTAVEAAVAFARAINLQAYAAAFDAEGYDDISFLRGLDAAERADVAKETGMKPGHAGRFVKFGFAPP
ncbi:hypothetical protein EMIHUDRAFT_199717 [Emiliania huxleyi CCMP1516]|uniref:AP2/ERF domain-containing protein n=2 Tax=Emiliania huxleyi TaxID=2903 RepID=A0A0D3L041_EMIH1|nr:hypothetical protein EMIHUDRAFT_199717 [Emiliania huxleyi CCMP1516]EOD41376.1 hypothetical protein EMIHUDRAFT_199717 [Emiliania huxleyi CCMP1516]|eukprot:XP_005793805.1 hypothetical protein EMIHUDRAFT_199717 [Emiliania huxleyi CCMP1516]